MKKEHSSATGSEHVYEVEVRSTALQPQEVDGLLIDNRWRPVTFASAPIGVKNRVYAAEANRHGFLTYEAAITLAHWFIANAERNYCLETRLVKIKFAWSYTTEELGVSAPISLFHQERDREFVERTESPEAVDAVARTGEKVTG